MVESLYKTGSLFLEKTIQSIVSILKVIFLSKWLAKATVPHNSKCLILGNGPSLKTSLAYYPYFKNGNDIICVNRFAQSNYYEIIKPNFYCLHDPAFYEFDPDKDDPFELNELFSCLIIKTTWPISIYMNIKAKKSKFLKSLSKINQNIKILYYNYIVATGFDILTHFLFSKGLAMPQCNNVLGASLVLAINNNYKEIIIMGADHSWHEELRLDEDNNIGGIDPHFYDLDSKPPKNLTVSQYHQIASLHKGVHIWFYNIYKAFYSYILIKNYAVSKGVRIYNASEKSYIDAFEKKLLRQILDC